MTETMTRAPCPGCGQPAEQEWCDVQSFGDTEPRLMPGELTCFTEDCRRRIRRQAELDYIAATGNLAMAEALSYRGWDWWVGRILVGITVGLWITSMVLWWG